MITRCERSLPTMPSTRDSRYPRGTCLAPGMWPASHSSLSRTSRSTAPFRFLTSEGSTSSIWLRILRMTSAPDGLMRSVSFQAKRIRFQYFPKDSVDADMGSAPGSNRCPYLPMTAVTMRNRSLLSQVLAVNTVLVTVTAFVAAMLAPDQAAGLASLQRDLLIGVAVVIAVLVNTLLLRHRLKPLEHLVETMERIDLTSPGQRAAANPNATRDIERLTAAFNRMLARVEEERLEGGRAVIRAQEEERARIAQDLHDEVNQALTAILLRLQAAALDVPPGLRSELKEIQTLATQAMEELLTLARTLRPTALDDHGLVPALASQVANFGERTGIKTTFHRHGDTPELSDEEQLVLYRVAQESLSNVVQHSGASAVRVELSSVGRTVLRVRDDGCGFKPERPQRPPRRLRHARARAARRRTPERLLRTR